MPLYSRDGRGYVCKLNPSHLQLICSPDTLRKSYRSTNSRMIFRFRFMKGNVICTKIKREGRHSNSVDDIISCNVVRLLLKWGWYGKGVSSSPFSFIYFFVNLFFYIYSFFFLLGRGAFCCRHGWHGVTPLLNAQSDSVTLLKADEKIV